MSLVEGIGYVELGVADLQESVAFYEDVCGLALVEERGGVAFLTGGLDHHWLRLQARPTPGIIRLGYKASSPEALNEVERRLSDAKIVSSRRDALYDDRVANVLRFHDPDGIEVELFEEMVQLPIVPRAARGGLTALLHAVMFAEDVVRSRDFYRQILGFRRSDQIENLVVFLRSANRYHHSIAFAKGSPPGAIDHFAILVDNLDEVMYFRGNGAAHGASGDGSDGLVRHAASGSISTYLRDLKNGHGVEFCTGHQVIEDESYGGRLLMASATTANLWAAEMKPIERPSEDERGPSAHELVSEKAP